MLSCFKSKQASHGQTIGVADGQMTAFSHAERSSVVILFFIFQENPQERKQKDLSGSPLTFCLTLTYLPHNDATAKLLHAPGGQYPAASQQLAFGCGAALTLARTI